jgi:MFS family permease
VIPGSIFYVFSIMMTSICKEYYQFILAQGMLGGISTGFLFTPSLAAISHYFQKRRGLAMGLCSGGASLGGLLFPIGLKHALYSKLQFGWGVRVIGFVILGLLVISSGLVKSRLPPRRGRLFIPRAFLQPSYSFLVAAIFLSMWALWVPYFYIVSFSLEKVHIDANLSFYILSLINAGSLFGRIIPGFIADKLGRLNVLVIVYAINSILLFGWIPVGSAAGVIVWTTVFGFASGAVISLYPASVAQITPNSQEIGTYMGQATGIVSIAGLTGPPIAGALIRNCGWTATAIFAGVSMSVCTILASIARGFHEPILFTKI